MLAALIVVAVVAATLAAGCAYLWADRRAVTAERARLGEQLAACETQRTKLADENRELVLRLERVEADRDAAQQRLEDARQQFDEAQKRARDTFQALAGDALKQANQQLLAQARDVFESRSKLDAEVWDRRSQAVDALVKPIRETLERYDAWLKEVEKAREGAYHALRQQVGTLAEQQSQLQRETANLVTALRRPEVRGRWGELQLRRVAELAGMIPHCDFDDQVTVWKGEQHQRPDMVVRLPGGRAIVVDAKTPISAFIEALECEREDDRARCLDQHVRHIETQVKSLASKGYREGFARTPDFVVLFIPGESFLQAAVERSPDLIERAMNASVLIATPTTLISLLKAVAVGWREEQVAENAQRIAALGQELHERIGVVTQYIENLGKHLQNAVKSYNDFVGSFESRVLVSARRFKELRADSAKELPPEGAVKQVEVSPRELRAVEEAQA